ncbi:MAG TPA: hypothetical protein VIK75_00345 [Calditerricola sp.]
MWIRNKQSLVNLDNLTSVYLYEMYGGKKGEVVGVTLNGDEIIIFKGPLEQAEAALAEVEAALMREGKLWVLPVQYRE